MDLPRHWPLPEAADLMAEVLAAYAEPSRRYHDTRHLSEVLDRIEQLRDAGERFDATAVVLAAFFHDAVYDGERDAEERSAAWAEDSLQPYVDARTLAEVVRLVRLTETHDPEPTDRNGRVLSDADLAILAAPRERYDEYAASVRAEYAYLGDEEFRLGRIHVLEGLLAKDTLFCCAHALELWESRARANVLRELGDLRPAL
ncbi:MAG: hypothetical protein J2O46_10890 [Nocardioides sp.]|nr:hypothetical protein [Nocardioides sp.]